ncbi:MAG: MFS transporter [Pseudomonadota bacterium]
MYFVFFLQFLGAFNDNVFKNALVILIAFHSIVILGMESQVLVTFSFALFILPFFLFSALAGQIADKYSKTTLIGYIKFCEIIIMILATIGLYFQHYLFLLLVLFLMGLQSTFFGPIKYSILPDLVDNISNESKQVKMPSNHLLVSANGLVEMGTFAAILCGTLLGGLLASSDFLVANFLPAILVMIAFTGWLLSFYLPRIKAADQQLKIRWNLWRESLVIISYAKENSSVFRVVLLISWFWFIGASVLSQLPNWTKNVLVADEYVVTILLTCFSLGVGLGSILCSKLHQFFKYSSLTRGASIGISLCLIFLVVSAFFAPPVQNLADQVHIDSLNINYFNLYFIFSYLSLLLLGFFGGLFIVPLYYFVQRYSKTSNLSRIIAANNIFNALFMVISSLILSLFLLSGIKLPVIFMLLSLFNIVMVYWILSRDKKDSANQQHFFDLD